MRVVTTQRGGASVVPTQTPTGASPSYGPSTPLRPQGSIVDSGATFIVYRQPVMLGLGLGLTPQHAGLGLAFVSQVLVFALVDVCKTIPYCCLRQNNYIWTKST